MKRIAIICLTVAVAFLVWGAYSIGSRNAVAETTKIYAYTVDELPKPAEGTLTTKSASDMLESLSAETQQQRSGTAFRKSMESVVRAKREAAGITEAEVSPGDVQVVTVYWVPGGKVWHSTSSCRTLSRSSDIREGTVEESGKARACYVCG